MKSFTKAAVALSALLAVSGSALAADISIADPAYDWSGLYMGANVGGAWNDGTWAPGSTVFDPFPVDGSGVAIGGQIGYRHQISSLVLGLEGNLDYLGLKAKDGCRGTIPTCRTKQNWLGSIQGQVGFAVDNFLVYGTGGVAFTSFKHRQTDTLVQSWDKDSRTGWTAGLGAEYAFTPNWSFGVQWNYYDFGTKTRGGGIGPVAVKFKETENVVAARVNFSF